MKKKLIILLLLIFSISQIFAAACGDVNNDGAVDIVDALLIAQDYVDLNPENYDPYVADVNNDNAIDIVDALLISQYYVNLISELNCGETSTPTPTPTPTNVPTATPGPTSNEGLIAFPGAEGYGKTVTGGRGGAVYEVTNLNKSGTGSFGEAIGASGPRTVVFRVSGTINGNFSISKDDCTIAGQTAPGDGICIRGNLSTRADNLIIRYLRVRYDPALGENDGMGGRFQRDIIIDHCSVSWSTDETLTLYHGWNTTVQWCIVAQACPKGTTDEHRFGGIWGNDYGTWHHNLIAHNASRNPRWASGCGYNDYRNNVIYNWGYENCYGGEAQQEGDSRFTFSTINMIANYYKAGPATASNKRYQIANPSERSSSDKGSWYVSDNYVVGSSSVTNDNWQGMSGSKYIKLSSPWNAMAINQESAQDAYNSVLNHVGCSMPVRDRVDADIIDDVQRGIAKYGDNGLIDSPSDVGGWPTLNSAPAPADSDHDGMPDAWENAHGLNPNNANDRNNTDSIGYTMLENYLNSIDNL